MKKSKIRAELLKIRKKYIHKNLSINFSALKRILIKNQIKGKIIGGYYSYNYEINCIELLEKFEKQNYLISLPKINKNYQMNFFQWSPRDPLSVNKLGIPEPTSNKMKYPDILLVPLVAFDNNLNRLGYGGGFYDRYIKKIKKIKNIITIGLAYSFQKVKKIPINKYDVKLDFVITEKHE